jgi:hypothetical protein
LKLKKSFDDYYDTGIEFQAPALQDLDYTHLVNQPRVLSFFKQYHPDIFKKHLLDNENLDVSGEWAVAYFALDESNDQQQYREKLETLALYKIFTREDVSRYPAIPGNVDDTDRLKNCAYLGYFVCQRRIAEEEKNFNAALNYLNSELCILLVLLDVQPKFSNTQKEKKAVFPDSLNQFEDTKNCLKDKLKELRTKRNKTDISHNAWVRPQDLGRVTLQEEYSELKTGVFAAINSHLENQK